MDIILPSFYTVETLHVNVGSGDCSIVVWTYGNSYDIGTRKVVWAILMDGGRNDGKSMNDPNDQIRESISQTITHIEHTYICTNKYDDKLRFNCFIVTHWDSDHYAGVIRALAVFMRESIEEDFQVNNRSCLNRAFYDDNGDPKSYFIAPYFTDPAPNTPYPPLNGGNWNSRGLGNVRNKVGGKLKGAIRSQDAVTVDISTALAWHPRQLLLRTDDTISFEHEIESPWL
ncbi:hypothetical protein ABW21_db0205502 [Orbilia brochopaga]|nr:hypothetical protein ABW21_db0205502 [Drechslerella brochopaga]